VIIIGRIGNLGSSIIFETSDKKILTFNGFTKKVSGNWVNHNIIGKKALSEFTGPGLEQVSFTITLDARLGVRPRAMIEKIESMVLSGKVEKLVIGGKAVGKNKWKVLNISETWDLIYSGGELAKATISLTLEEYL
jgi:Phage protein U